MKPEIMGRKRIALTTASIITATLFLIACNDDGKPSTPEPVVVPYVYLSVGITVPRDGREVSQVIFYGDDLKEYGYEVRENGSRRLTCTSATFVDQDDEILAEDDQSITVASDPDNVFEMIDLNGNIARFSPTTTGATSRIIHQAGEVFNDEQIADYFDQVKTQVNKMSNQIFEVKK